MSEPTRIDRGDVFWVAPAEEQEPGVGSAHPHVVVQDDVFNPSRITTVDVLLEPGEGNLPKQSVVVVSRIASITKARLLRGTARPLGSPGADAA